MLGAQAEFDAVETRAGAGAAQGGHFHTAGHVTEGQWRQAAGGERVLQQREQRQGGVIGHGGAGEQAQQRGGRGLGQGFAGAVIGGDAETLQGRGHAGGEATVRCDEGGGGAGGFQRVAQDHGNGGGVLGFVSGFQPGEAGDVQLWRGLPSRKRGGGQQGAGEHLRAALRHCRLRGG